MTQEEKQEIALMRYSAIAPLVAGWMTLSKANPPFLRLFPPKASPGPMAGSGTSPPLPLSGGIPSIISFGFDSLLPKGRPTPA